ncbi:hypothetical protein BACCIP111883_02085 [Sutcliffiella rhizosphaerae]|uniref:NADH dehydrogenase subunit 1 n=1 Tax=Sutcliffiella rhizosphaerae TaxID=2880967 RepID=A0ABN8A882_9BACI|nr:hypothetical protein BACCIP111883_02085 [Sutcliffiella rhizosphaerae]
MEINIIFLIVVLCPIFLAACYLSEMLDLR